MPGSLQGIFHVSMKLIIEESHETTVNAILHIQGSDLPEVTQLTIN